MSLISDIFGGKDTGEGYNQAGLNALANLNPPSAEDLKVQLQQMVYAGDITPEMAATIQQNPSLMNTMTYDTTGKGAQLEALSRLQGISTNGGMDATDKAKLNDIESRTGQQERGAREAVMQNARERGVGGGGNELVAQLMADQNGATNANAAGLDVASQAQQRALQAIQQSGQLGGQIESQNYGEEANKAAAQDAINKFNTQNSQAVVGANTAAKNAAIARNVDTKQAISSGNTDIANTQAKLNSAAKQTAFQDQVQKAGGVASQTNTMAAGQRNATDRSLDAWGNVVNAGMTGAVLSSDETKKKDVKDVSGIDLESFMSSLDPKKFQYKDPAAPGASDGENVGVMAQDVEKTPVGKTMVKDTAGGKVIDVKKALGVLLAAISELNDRVEEKEAA